LGWRTVTDDGAERRTMESTGAAGDPQTFRALVRQHRQAASLSQEALAERAGLSVDAISVIERGKRGVPRPDTVALLARALGLSSEERAAFIAAARAIGVPPAASVAPARTSPLTLPPLPAFLTALVGRVREVAAVRERLLQPGTRLLTLTGPGGVGKTRLAVEVARTVVEDFPAGIAFVSLAALTDPALALPAIAHALGLSDASGRTAAETLATALANARLLLVLDNFEQVAAVGPEITKVLAATPGVTALVTSRERLRLRGERVVPVPPLDIPDPMWTLPVDGLLHYDAVRLFVERARDAQPDFALTGRNAAQVVEICARLDGLPLAIELVAARLPVLPPHALVSLLARQQTLRAAIDWSYNLLTSSERQLFARLAVCAGGCSLGAIEAIRDAGDDQTGDALEGVEGLVAKSLLQPQGEDVAGGEPRFMMLETIREYAEERLAASGEAERVRRRHAAYYLNMAEGAEPGLHGPAQADWLARLEADQDNLRAALHWARERGDAEIGLRLAGALYLFWHMRGYAAEGQAWLESLLALADTGTIPAAVRARALHAAGTLAHYLGDYDRATRRYEEALTMRRRLGDAAGLSASLNNAGLLASEQGAHDRATALYEESFALARSLGDPEGMSITLNNLGDVARAGGDHARAAAAYRESLALAEARGDTAVVAEARTNLGDVAREQGDLRQAETCYRESLALLRDVNEGRLIALNLGGLATVSGRYGDMERAARLFGAAAARREEIGAAVSPDDRMAYDRAVAFVSVALGDQAFETAWAEGYALPMEQAVTQALGEAMPQ